MKKTRYKEPYNKLGKTNFGFTENKSGVYLIKSKRTNKIVYVGYSGSNLYKTMYRHFQSWIDETQTRVTYNKTGYAVRVVFTTPKRASLLERALIIKYEPKDNTRDKTDKLGRYVKKGFKRPTKMLRKKATRKQITIPEKKVLDQYEKDSEWLEATNTK